jgi:hypothetical protein
MGAAQLQNRVSVFLRKYLEVFRFNTFGHCQLPIWPSCEPLYTNFQNFWHKKFRRHARFVFSERLLAKVLARVQSQEYDAFFRDVKAGTLVRLHIGGPTFAH